MAVKKILTIGFLFGLAITGGSIVTWKIQPTTFISNDLDPRLRGDDKISTTANRHTSSPSPLTWSMVITGDVIPARVVNIQMIKRNDFSWPLRGIKEPLQNADLTLIDLEAPLLVNCPLTNEGFKFCGDARFAAALADAGVDVANIANNHSLNYGWDGIRETEEELSKVGINTTGFYNQKSVILERSDRISIEDSITSSADGRTSFQNDEYCAQNSSCSKLLIKTIPTSADCTLPTANCVTVGFLGYNAVGQRVNRELVQSQIESADKEVDVLVVSVHWGKEYEREPVSDLSLAPDDPRELGKLFVDWGADVVVGNHPHWYQGIEWKPFDSAQGKVFKPIFYALGNTVFDQEWSTETKRGYLAKLYFDGTEIQKDKLELFPIGIRNYGEVYMLEGEEKDQVLRFFNSTNN